MVINISRKILKNFYYYFVWKFLLFAFKNSKKLQWPYKVSFAQEGEDILLDRIFNKKKKGFYIDIGAHHPIRFSSTFWFYKKGWNGINIDPLPGTKKLFDRHRPRDINLELGVANSKQNLIYYEFEQPALNTFDLEMSRKRMMVSKLKSKKAIKVSSIKEILSKNLDTKKTIDFMNIDGQGLEMDILLANDWNIYRPLYVLVECLAYQGLSIAEVIDKPIYNFMKSQNYNLYSKTFSTLIFQDINI